MPDTLAVEHRRALSRLTGLTTRRLEEVWDAVVGPDAVAVRDALLVAVPPIGDAHGDAAAALAADFYENSRDAAGASGRFVAQPAPLPDVERYDALVRWGVNPLFTGGPDAAELALSKIGGGLHMVVADMSRETIVRSSLADPAASGWRRVTDNDPCKFCRMLADRGAVYTEDSVTFKSHDDCGCSASPAFDPGRQVSTVQYVASKRNITDTDRARVREYLAANY